MTRAIYVPLGIYVNTFCFSEPIVCFLIGQTTLFTQSHYNNLVFCLHLFNPLQNKQFSTVLRAKQIDIHYFR